MFWCVAKKGMNTKTERERERKKKPIFFLSAVRSLVSVLWLIPKLNNEGIRLARTATALAAKKKRRTLHRLASFSAPIVFQHSHQYATQIYIYIYIHIHSRTHTHTDKCSRKSLCRILLSNFTEATEPFSFLLFRLLEHICIYKLAARPAHMQCILMT